MTQQFNADETFEIAEQIERNGAEFYKKAADLAPDDAARDLFLELTAMEERHEKKIAQPTVKSRLFSCQKYLSPKPSMNKRLNLK